MPTAILTAGSPSIADERVHAATGKHWDQWFALLDKWGAAKKEHKAIAIYLSREQGVAPWWSQMVTVEYERARGRREVNQTARGFEVQVQRTLPAGIESVWEAFAETRHLNKWFTTKAKQQFREGGAYANADGGRGKFVTILPHRKLTFTWENPEHSPGSMVTLDFLPKGAEKTVVHITQYKLASKAQVAEQKEGWTWALASLRHYLETGKGLPVHP